MTIGRGAFKYEPWPEIWINEHPVTNRWDWDSSTRIERIDAIGKVLLHELGHRAYDNYDVGQGTEGTLYDIAEDLWAMLYRCCVALMFYRDR